MKNESKAKLNMALVLMIVLLAANMRACYTGVGTIVDLIQAELGMNATVAGLITTIPILVFAVVCPVSAPFAAKCGIGRMIALGMALNAVGCAMRAFGGAVGLFAGTAVLSVGVGIMNALMVGLIKLRFPDHAGLVTSCYTTTMALTSAVGISINVPIASAIGWKWTLAVYGILAAVTLLIWLPMAGKKENNVVAGNGESGLMGRLVRSPKAWNLMLFMGTQSMLFYCITAWVPSILRWKGMTAEEAAVAATVLQLVSLPSTLLIPILAEKLNWRALILGFDICYIVGIAMFYFLAVDSIALWVAICLMAAGLGSGFSSCVFLFAQKTSTPGEASAVSGFAQSGGYVFAAVGPVLMGWLFDRSGSWNGGIVFCFVVVIAMTVFSILSADKSPVM